MNVDPQSPLNPMILAEMMVSDPANLLLEYVPGDDWAAFGGTFARNGPATFVDANGVVQTAAINVPRDGHYIGGVPCMLREDTRTNGLTWCRDLTNAAWTKNAATAALTATGVDAVANSASTVLETAANVSHSVTRASATFTANTVQSLRVCVKANGRTRGFFNLFNGSDFLSVAFDTGAGTVTSAVSGAATLTRSSIALRNNGWCEITMSGKVNASSTTGTVKVDILDAVGNAVYLGDVTKGLLLDGFQHEVDALFPSSIIFTTSLAVTRAADFQSFPTAFGEASLTVDVGYFDLGTQQAGAGAVTGVYGLGDYNTKPVLFAASNGGTTMLAGFHNGTTQQNTGNVTTGIVYGDRVRLRTTFNDIAGVSVVATLFLSRNGGTETASTGSISQAAGSGWGGSKILINQHDTTTPPGFAAFTHIRVASGIQTTNTMPGRRTLYAANVSGYTTKATDFPPGVTYRGRMLNPGEIAINVLEAWSKGIATYGIGALVLNNDDSSLDDWHRYTFDGFPINYYLGVLNATGDLTKSLFFSGIMEQPDAGMTQFTIPHRTQTYGLDKPILTATFAGSGTLEGDVNVKGQFKPRVIGWAANMAPVPVDAANVTYFYSDRLCSAESVCDEGLPLIQVNGPGAFNEFLSVALMNAATVSAGHYAFAFDGGKSFLRLHQPPDGVLTLFGADRFVNSIFIEPQIAQLLADAAVSHPSVVCDASYPVTSPGTYPSANLNAAFGKVIVDGSTTFAQAISEYVASAAGWLWYNPVSQVWILGNLPSAWGSDPSAALVVVSDSDITDITRLGNPKNPGEGIPPWMITVNFDRLMTVQASGLAATVTPSQRARVGSEFQQRSHTDRTTLMKYPLAQSITVNAPCLTDASVFALSSSIGSTLADQYFAALALGYEFYTITANLSARFLQQYSTPASGTVYKWIPATMPSFRGANLGIKSNRLGFTNTGKGHLAGVMSPSLDLANKKVTWVVYTRHVAA